MNLSNDSAAAARPTLAGQLHISGATLAVVAVAIGAIALAGTPLGPVIAVLLVGGIIFQLFGMVK